MGQAMTRNQRDLERKGHYALNWEDLDKIELPTGVISTMYRVGDPTRAESPTVFKVFYPPECTIEAHTHDCDYTEIILEGSQRVGPLGITLVTFASAWLTAVMGRWLRARGRDSALHVATGAWPAIKLGNNDGSTLGSDILEAHFEKCNPEVEVYPIGFND